MPFSKQLLKKYSEEHNALVIISSHNLNHTVDVCSRIALLENGVIIRDIQNVDNSAEKELEAYFNVRIDDDQPISEWLVGTRHDASGKTYKYNLKLKK